MVERTFKMQLNFRILLRKPHQRRRGKQRVQTVRDADAHQTFRFAALRLQVTGEGMESMVEPRQSLRERFALFGQLDARECRDEKLRPHRILEPLDLPAYRRLARVGDLGSPVERFGLGDGQEDPKLGPELSAQKGLFIERALVEGAVPRRTGAWFPMVVTTIMHSLSANPDKSPLTHGGVNDL